MEKETSQYLSERKTLIERLMERYPYTFNWFEKQSTSKLIKMYNNK